jgi:hypothetical protein
MATDVGDLHEYESGSNVVRDNWHTVNVAVISYGEALVEA